MADETDPLEPTHPLQRNVSRRSLFTGLFSSARRVAASGEPETPGTTQAPIVPPGRVTQQFLPTAETLHRDLETMVSFGPRFPGSGAHDEFLAWTKQELVRSGCYLRSSIDHPDTLWVPVSWGLRIASEQGSEEIRVAAFRARSGGTEPDASPHQSPVSRPLVYLGPAPTPETAGRDLATARQDYQNAMKDWFTSELAARQSSIDGAILVVDLGGVPVFTQGYIGAMAGCYFTQTPNHLTWPLWNQGRPYRKLWMLPDPGEAMPRSAKPAGVIYVVDACYEELEDQFLPAWGAVGAIPTLVLDREAGERVRAAAQEQSVAELHLSATMTPVRVSDLVLKLPGTVEDQLGHAADIEDRSADEVEYVVITAASDGVSAVHGNGCIALVNIARYFAALKEQGVGLRRTLVFSTIAGALGSQPAPKTRRFIDRHPRIMARTAFAMSIENLGCSEWVEDERGFGPTGFPEPAVIYHDEGLTPLVYDSYIGTPLFNHGISTGRAHYFGLGRSLAQLVPTVSFIAGPTYLHQADSRFASAGRIEHLDPKLFARQLEVLIGILAGFDQLPAAGRGSAA